MFISTNYLNTGYTQYTDQVLSTDGQQQVHHKRHLQNSEASTQSVTDSTQNASNTDSDPLASLVENGTITSDQEQAIKNAFDSARSTFQAQMGGFSSSTPTNPLDSLVNAGTITQDQADAIKSTLDSTKDQFKMAPPIELQQQQQQSGNSVPISSALDSLVVNKTITSEQKDSIISALQSAFESNSTKSTSTQSESSTDPLTSLVTNGTITEDQKSTVNSAFNSAIQAYLTQSASFYNTFNSSGSSVNVTG